MRRDFFVGSCALSARDNVYRSGTQKNFGAHPEMVCEESYLRTRHDKKRSSKRKSGSQQQFKRHGETAITRCPQLLFFTGHSFFSYFFLVVKMSFCESEPCCFSHIEVPKTPRCLLFFIHDSPKTSLVRSYWWSQKFSTKALSRNIAIR